VSRVSVASDENIFSRRRKETGVRVEDVSGVTGSQGEE
jgi:hypothetical protein